MKPDRICRAHHCSPVPDMTPGACMAVPRDTDYNPTEPCETVSMVWSGDGHALLEVVECDDHQEPRMVPAPCPDKAYGGGGELYGRPQVSCLVAHYEQVLCPKCGGSGWRYAARIRDDNSRGSVRNFPPEWVAVVPVKPLDKEG